MSTIHQDATTCQFDSPLHLLHELDLVDWESVYHWDRFEQSTLEAQHQLILYDAVQVQAPSLDGGVRPGLPPQRKSGAAMSDAEKRPYDQVLTVANCLVTALHPACHRIEIAGSLRRKKTMVGDIEIVAVPILHTNLIGDPMDTSEVDDLLAAWPITCTRMGKVKAISLSGNLGCRSK